MGLKNLNTFLKKMVGDKPDTIQSVNINTPTDKFSVNDKVIAIDALIYIYKFAEENTENNNKYILRQIYKMVNLFLNNDAIPIFIFDTKTRAEKDSLLKQRKQNKKIAEDNYNKLILDSDSDPEVLIKLKKQFVKVRKSTIDEIKLLLQKIGIEFYDSNDEADILCAKLVNADKAFACVSDDMDMFIYGCKRVIRNLDIETGSCTLYITSNILKELNISLLNFRQILVLCGTDYNIEDTCDLYMMFRLYNDYLNKKLKWNKNCGKYATSICWNRNENTSDSSSPHQQQFKRFKNESYRESGRDRDRNKWGFSGANTTTPTTISPDVYNDSGFYEWIIKENEKKNSKSQTQKQFGQREIIYPIITENIIKTYMMFDLNSMTEYDCFEDIYFNVHSSNYEDITKMLESDNEY